MEDLSLHVMDLAENSIRAGASRIDILVEEDVPNRRLTIVLKDNGRGMNAETQVLALDPFYTSKEGKRVGLGLPLFRQSAEETGGELTVESIPGKGTVVRAEFRTDHPDLKPLGDIEETVALLRIFHPEVTFFLDREKKEPSRNGRQQ
ncbi:MAG: ATP-binding protein [Spirochaetales bacterium]|nr:MAG: ATP-binding protein [Spirochaetales bacterium]